MVDEIPETAGKNKDADMLMQGLSNVEGSKPLRYKKANNVYLSVKKGNDKAKRAFRNLPYVTLHNVEDLNPLDLANTRYLVIANPEETIEYLSSKVTAKAEVRATK